MGPAAYSAYSTSLIDINGTRSLLTWLNLSSNGGCCGVTSVAMLQWLKSNCDFDWKSKQIAIFLHPWNDLSIIVLESLCTLLHFNTDTDHTGAIVGGTHTLCQSGEVHYKRRYFPALAMSLYQKHPILYWHPIRFPGGSVVGYGKKMKTLSFQSNWFKQYPWLHYSPTLKGALPSAGSVPKWMS